MADACKTDDIRGTPVGHFVVLCGYNRDTKMVRIADPYLPNPFAPRDNYYEVNVDRVVCAILLGILTYDANLLILRPSEPIEEPTGLNTVPSARPARACMNDRYAATHLEAVIASHHLARSNLCRS